MLSGMVSLISSWSNSIRALLGNSVEGRSIVRWVPNFGRYTDRLPRSMIALNLPRMGMPRIMSHLSRLASLNLQGISWLPSCKVASASH